VNEYKYTGDKIYPILMNTAANGRLLCYSNDKQNETKNCKKKTQKDDTH